jgi:hypothetical protein
VRGRCVRQGELHVYSKHASPWPQDSEFSRIDEDFEAEQASLISARKAASFLSSSEQVGSPTSDLNVQRASELGGWRSDAR